MTILENLCPGKVSFLKPNLCPDHIQNSASEHWKTLLVGHPGHIDLPGWPMVALCPQRSKTPRSYM